ncbi:MAG TPA: DUF4844 domain-containing protein [Falsiroseomonas sp.]|nr:DUF4844 domain-containing protein [Falsiroseomonas sp.]
MRLEALLGEPKFLQEPDRYTGIHPLSARQEAEEVVNSLIRDLLGNGAARSRRAVLRRCVAAIKASPVSDTEDRERLARYLCEILDFLNMDACDWIHFRCMRGPIFGRISWLISGKRHDTGCGPMRSA